MRGKNNHELKNISQTWSWLISVCLLTFFARCGFALITETESESAAWRHDLFLLDSHIDTDRDTDTDAHAYTNRDTATVADADTDKLENSFEEFPKLGRACLFIQNT